MADTKISALTALTGASVQQTSDVLAIVDTSVTTTKKILVSELAQALLVSGTAQATTSGTSKDFTIPTWAKRVTVLFNAVSLNGTSDLLVQLSDSGTVRTTNYDSAYVITPGGTTNSANASSTAGFIITLSSASTSFKGRCVIELMDPATFIWQATAVGKYSTGNMSYGSGDKTLAAAIDGVRITTVNGTDAFDAGAVNVIWE